jgi:hypothetical protein
MTPPGFEQLGVTHEQRQSLRLAVSQHLTPLECTAVMIIQLPRGPLHRDTRLAARLTDDRDHCPRRIRELMVEITNAWPLCVRYSQFSSMYAQVHSRYHSTV